MYFHWFVNLLMFFGSSALLGVTAWLWSENGFAYFDYRYSDALYVVVTLALVTSLLFLLLNLCSCIGPKRGSLLFSLFYFLLMIAQAALILVGSSATDQQYSAMEVAWNKTFYQNSTALNSTVILCPIERRFNCIGYLNSTDLPPTVPCTGVSSYAPHRAAAHCSSCDTTLIGCGTRRTTAASGCRAALLAHFTTRIIITGTIVLVLCFHQLLWSHICMVTKLDEAGASDGVDGKATQFDEMDTPIETPQLGRTASESSQKNLYLDSEEP